MMNVFKLKQRKEAMGPENDPHTIEMEVEGVKTEVPFKLVELSYWEASQAAASSNIYHMAAFYGMRHMDGKQLFAKMEDMEAYPVDLTSVGVAVVALSDRVPTTDEGVVELEKKSEETPK